MATVDDIIEWARSLPAWQGDVVRRLLSLGERPLSNQEYAEILALAKADLELAPPLEGLKPACPSAGMVSGAPAVASAVQLLSISDVQNVNAIRNGATQTFSEQGITVIYGNNGSGKSGFSRILKLACQARDKDEAILPNVFATAPTGTPSATLKIKKSGKPIDIGWSQGAPVDPVLTNITVFDSRCARTITDERNEIVYLPYGADVFQKTAEIVKKVKADLLAEEVVLNPITDSAVESGTSSASFLTSISEHTSDEDLESATRWTAEDDVELAEKEELARLSDPSNATEEVARIRRRVDRITTAGHTVAELLASYRGLTNDAIRNAIAEVKAAKQAHEIAVAERATLDTLPGVASTDEWNILYSAAKEYSEGIAYPGEPFPKTDDALCVLCQQPLKDSAVARFHRFKARLGGRDCCEEYQRRNDVKAARRYPEAAVTCSNFPDRTTLSAKSSASAENMVDAAPECLAGPPPAPGANELLLHRCSISL